MTSLLTLSQGSFVKLPGIAPLRRTVLHQATATPPVWFPRTSPLLQVSWHLAHTSAAPPSPTKRVQSLAQLLRTWPSSSPLVSAGLPFPCSLGFASACSHLPKSRSGYSALGSDPRCTNSVSYTRCPPFVVTSSSSVLERRCSLQVLLPPSLREDLLMIHSTASVTYVDEFPMNLAWLRAYLPK